MKGITGNSVRRAHDIPKKREDKGSPFTFEEINVWNTKDLGGPLIQSGEITLEQEENEYIAEKETESMSSENERVQKLERYNA